jgi:DNA-binding NarL/FixJ family response regulator
MQLHPSLDPLDDLAPDLDLDLGLAVRALVVADDPLIGEGFVSRLGKVAAGRARTTDDLTQAAARAHANLVLWDLGPTPLPTSIPTLIMDETQFAGLDDLELPIVALAAPGVDARTWLARGVSGVLLRDTPGHALHSALETVLHGLTVVDPSLLEPTGGDAVTTAGSIEGLPLEPLTPRETEVLELLGAGLSNKAIARTLGISTHTVKFHIAALLEKLDASSRTEAVIRAVQLGLVMI